MYLQGDGLHKHATHFNLFNPSQMQKIKKNSVLFFYSICELHFMNEGCGK